jgi:hypothetical protein
MILSAMTVSGLSVDWFVLWWSMILSTIIVSGLSVDWSVLLFAILSTINVWVVRDVVICHFDYHYSYCRNLLYILSTKDVCVSVS